MSGRGRARAGMWQLVIANADEAARIRSTQAALVEAGIREAPDPTQMRRADTFEDAADFIRALIPVRAEIDAILRRARKEQSDAAAAEAQRTA
jgi:hypothetical protein